MKTLTVIVPFYNEARTMGELVRQLSELDNHIIEHCIFVDDGSLDNSYNILQESLLVYPLKCTVIKQPNMGKASAIKTAVKELTTTHALIFDADLELDIADIPKLWSIVTKCHADIVFGYRDFLAQSSFTYRYARGNRLISHFFGLLFNEVITDVMCGLKLLPTEFWKKCEFKFSNFAVEVEIPLIMWKNSMKPFEVHVNYSPRTREQGKIIGFKDALQIFAVLFYFRITNRRPV